MPLVFVEAAGSERCRVGFGVGSERLWDAAVARGDRDSMGGFEVRDERRVL